jgi:GST-like protein
VRHVDGHATFESGAILIELADRAGRLLPADGPERSRVLSWLFMQVGSVGPMLGQLWWFRHAGAANTQALERYEREVRRIYGVVERRLAESAFIGTSTYGIADIAMYPWLASHEELGIDLDAYPNVARWIATVAARPAVVRGLRYAAPPARAAA